MSAVIGQLQRLVGMGIQTVYGAVPHVDRITPLELVGREVTPIRPPANITEKLVR